jgi:dTDP-4-amino-4,6-dideoxygalactose transaminase
VPRLADQGHVYHLFPVLTPEREAVRTALGDQGIETLVHYPIPMPRQQAFSAERPDECPVADLVCGQVFSLPLHQHLEDADVERVIAAVEQVAGA